MLLSGLFRTLKEKMFLSVTFTNAGNSSFCLSSQLSSSFIPLKIPKVVSAQKP